MASVDSCKAELASLQTAAGKAGLSNREKRALYKQAEELWHKIKESLPEEDATPLCKAIDTLEDWWVEEGIVCLVPGRHSRQLRLTPAQLTRTPLGRAFQWLDMVIRFFTCTVYLTLLGMITFVPMASIVPVIDRVLRQCGWPSNYLLYDIMRRLSSYLFLLLAGVFFTTEGKAPGYDTPLVLLFQHGSNLDGFIILNSFPQYFKSIGKEDIFLMPYVGWMAYIFGILPIDRKHRNDAIMQMNRATNYCKRGVTVALSPEGTRSKTGQLMRFKKGPFYVRHDADADVVPLVILGNYELWPPSYIFSCPGQVVLRYLRPIKAADIKTKGISRDALSRDVRRQMLDAISDVSSSDKYHPGAPLTWSLRALNVAAIIIFWTLVYQLWIRIVVVRKWLGATRLQAWLVFIAYSVLVTMSLFYFYCKRPNAAARKKE